MYYCDICDKETDNISSYVSHIEEDETLQKIYKIDIHLCEDHSDQVQKVLREKKRSD